MITIRQITHDDQGEETAGKPLFRIFAEDTKAQIGLIYFNALRDKYIFAPGGETFYDESDLTQILTFIQKI